MLTSNQAVHDHQNTAYLEVAFARRRGKWRQILCPIGHEENSDVVEGNNQLKLELIILNLNTPRREGNEQLRQPIS